MICKLRLPLAVLALALASLSTTAHAQFGVYGMFSVDRMTDISTSPILQTLSPLPCTSTTTTNCTTYNDHVNPLGFTGGATWDFKTFGPATLGVDLRGSIASWVPSVVIDHMRRSLDLEIATILVVIELSGECAFDVPWTRIMPFDEVAIVAVHDAHEAREVCGCARM